VADKQVDSVCPYCGVGCQLTYHVKDNKIVRVEGKDGPANHERLCVKGRFGFDYVAHPQRLTQPLIRKAGVPKTADFTVDPTRWSDVFREATWEEALDLAANGLKKVRDTKGPSGLAGFGSAKGSNEEAYLFQKLVRTGFGTNNVDHCTRLCHASSVVALLEGIGSGAVSNQVGDVENSEVIFLIGANPTSNHPVAATWLKNAAERGAKLIVADPRRNELARLAWRNLQFTADMDVALLNAMIYTIIEEGLVAEDFVRNRTSGYDALKENAKDFSPEKMAPLCGIPAETIREVARAYATSKASIILWGMGISQHVHGTDNARCLIALTLMTGQIGAGHGAASAARPEQRAGRVGRGPDPDDVPGLPARGQPRGQRALREVLGPDPRQEAGAHVVEIMDAACDGRSRACTSWARTRRCRIPTRTTRARAWLPSTCWWCRTSSSPRPPISPTWCCRPRRGRRRPARSPTPTAWCSSAGARSTCPATPARTCGSSSSSRTAWAAAGSTKGPRAAWRRCTTRCATR
jgi:formate dehydrogenase major subunit